jgi:hypothetical protein
VLVYFWLCLCFFDRLCLGGCCVWCYLAVFLLLSVVLQVFSVLVIVRLTALTIQLCRVF